MESSIIDHIKEKILWYHITPLFKYTPYKINRTKNLNISCFNELILNLNIYPGVLHTFKIYPSYEYNFYNDYLEILDLAPSTKSLVIEPSDSIITYRRDENDHTNSMLKMYKNNLITQCYYNNTINIIFHNNRKIETIEILDLINRKIVIGETTYFNIPDSIIKYSFDTNGIMKVENYETLGNEQTLNIENYPNGKIKLSVKTIKNNEEQGLFFQIIDNHDQDGKIIIKEGRIFKDFYNNLHFYRFIYYPNGKVKKFTSYIGGKISGFDITFYSTGKIKELYTYKNGSLCGPFFKFDSNDNLTLEGNYLNNSLNDFYQEIENGEIKYQGTYKVKDGASIKNGYWLEKEGETLKRVYYGPSTNILYFSSAPK